MSNNQSTSNINMKAADKISQAQVAYGTDRFNFTWLIVACGGMMLYYAVEMVNRVLFVALDQSIIDDWTNRGIWTFWRSADSVFLSFMFILIGIQALSWRRKNLGLDSKKKARNIFFSVIGAGIFLALYEILTDLRSELDYSHRGDLTVPFLFMIILHFYGFILLKNLISMIGRYKGVRTGESIFYTLFAANPVVRYLLPFLILIFAQLAGAWATIFFVYSELAMTYISAVIAIGFFVMIVIDANKISTGHLMMKHDDQQKDTGLPEMQGVRIIELQNKTIKVPLKQNVSVFCPKCGRVIYDDAKQCPNCQAKIS